LPQGWIGPAVPPPGSSAAPAIPGGKSDGADAGLRAVAAAGGVLALTVLLVVILARRSTAGSARTASPATVQGTAPAAGEPTANTRPADAAAADTRPSDATTDEARPTDTISGDDRG
jgi:hypothetical protein